jgi:hypothetical protein
MSNKPKDYDKKISWFLFNHVWGEIFRLSGIDFVNNLIASKKETIEQVKTELSINKRSYVQV